MRVSRLPAVVVLCLFCAALPARAVDRGMDTFLPVPACATGWNRDGKTVLFDKDSLFDRINGESELYFPYGFETLAYARYESKQNPLIAIDADVYKMGSLTDAFGMFANYRKKDDADIAVGAEGTISSSQLFFYQDRYFIRLQATGTTNISREPLLACARSISQNLPKNASKPRELEAFSVPGLVKKSVRYIAQSLLGYEFFHRGFIADTVLNSGQIQVFAVIGRSQEDARKTLEQYRSYLQASGGGVRVDEAKNVVSLDAIDPLYEKVFVEQEGRFVVGAIRVKELPAAKELVERVRIRLTGE